ncbi:hypothetical protein QFZ96_004693 [Paraburkholderia youngii]
MAARRLRHRNAAALQIGQRAQGAVLLHDDRLRARRWRFLRDIDEARMRGLGEDRHGVGDIGAEVDGIDVERFGQRQSARELVPGDAHVERRERFFQRSACLQQRDERRRPLIADAQRDRRGLREAARSAGGQ